MEASAIIGALSGERPLRLDREGARLALAHLAVNHPELLAMGLARARARATAAGRSTAAIDRASERHPLSDPGAARAGNRDRADKWMAVRVRSTSSLAEGAALELRAAAWAHQDRITADEADIAEGRRPPARPDTALAFDRASEQLDRSLDPDLRRSGHDPESVQGPEGAGLLSRGPMPAQQRTEPPALVEIRLPDPGLVGADHARKVTQSLESAFRSLDPAELVARHAAGREEAVRRRGPTGSLLAGEYARGVAVIERIAAERGIPLSADPRQKTARHVAGRRPDTNER